MAQVVVATNVLWFGLGAVAQLEVERWQVSHAAPGAVGGWFCDLPTAGGNPPVWQLPQLATGTVTLLCTLAKVHEVMPFLWQVSQFGATKPATLWYGTWVAWRASAGGFAPLWQVEQLGSGTS